MEEKAHRQLFSPIRAAVSGRLNRNPALKRDPRDTADRELAGGDAGRGNAGGDIFSWELGICPKSLRLFGHIVSPLVVSRPVCWRGPLRPAAYSAARAKVSNGVKPVAPR